MAKFDEMDIAYHRSFLSKQAISPCNPGCHGTPYKGPFNGMDVGPILLPSKPGPYGQFPKLPGMARPTPKLNQTYYYDYPAYRLSGTRLIYWPIVAKTDQDFASYATPFERWASKLASVHGALDPVVDEDLMVVGHVGFLNAMYFFKPAGLGAWGADTYEMNELEALWARNIPLFIARNMNDSVLWEQATGLGDEVSFMVYTRVDGGVVRVFHKVRSHPGAVSDDIQPTDLFFIGKAIIDLGGAAGRRLAFSILRNEEKDGATALLEGATKGVARDAAARETSEAATRVTPYIRRSGIAQAHFKAFQEAAKETELVAVVRNGNEAAIPLIEKGCPGKPKIFEPFNTSKSTGILTATTEADKELVYKSNYILVNDSRVATRRLANGSIEKVELNSPFWQLEPGQVIDPALKKPVVGDYDLMGVFSQKNPGQNITLYSVGGNKVQNMTSPVVEELSKSVNRRLDMSRVLHGAQDQYAAFRKGATAFFPDGTVLYMETEDEVKAFYNAVGRQTIKGSYAPAR